MMNIPFHIPHLPKSTAKVIKQVIDSGWITTGANVHKFEKEFSDLIGSKYSLAVSSCTAALHLALLAHGIKEGDEVIVPSFTFCSSVNTIVHVGASPVFCDISEETLCSDPQDIEKKITKKTKAIVVVHYSGMSADMDKINLIAKKNNLIVIEDAAHAFTAMYKGKYIGSGKNTTCFSFYATKNLTTAEGGMLTTSDNKVNEFVQTMRLHGISKNAWNRYSNVGSWRYDVLAPGYKYNMTDIQAVMGLEQLKIVSQSVERRKKLVKKYRELLSDNKNIILPNDVSYKNSQHAWHLFTIRLLPSTKISRDELIEELKGKGIGTSVHFIPNHMQTFYKDNYKLVKLPVTEKVFDSILSLPFYEDLTDTQLKYICTTINQLTI